MIARASPRQRPATKVVSEVNAPTEANPAPPALRTVSIVPCTCPFCLFGDDDDDEDTGSADDLNGSGDNGDSDGGEDALSRQFSGWRYPFNPPRSLVYPDLPTLFFSAADNTEHALSHAEIAGGCLARCQHCC